LSEEPVLGFDTEKKPTFKKGEYNYVSLLQLSTHDEAYLFQLSQTGLHRSLKLLMEDENILKLGVAIRDDLVDLKKLSPFDPDGFIDLAVKAKDVGIPHYGLRKLAAFLLDARLSKAQQTSNWENHRLTDAQQLYAATDAWVALKIYDEMKKFE
jgi:ribonuclease D